MTYFLGIIENGHWRPGIGDPTFIGWLITGLYLIAAFICGICAWRSDRIFSSKHTRHHHVFWWTLTVLMLLMAINKQLDLQSWLLLVCRKAARAQGWYTQRNIVRTCFIASVSIFSLTLVAWLGWKYRRVLKHYGLALLGIMLLLSFIAIRAGSNQMKIFGRETEGFQKHYILEISSITCIGVSALINIIREKRQAVKPVNS